MRRNVFRRSRAMEFFNKSSGEHASVNRPLLRQNYVNQGFGVFLHWGMPTYVSSDNANPNLALSYFAPTGYDVGQWLDAIASSGAKYAVLTTKHHDGFANWNTSYSEPGYAPYGIAQTDWYANNGSPDVVGDFVNQCRSHNVNPCLYFSIWDKTYEARTGKTIATATADYTAMIKLQLRELLTNYGNITAIWFDGWGWNSSFGYYNYVSYQSMFDYITGIQPNCLVIDNAHAHPSYTSEIETYESNEGAISASNKRLSESCATVYNNGHWFYHVGDDQTATALKSAATIKTAIANNKAANASYLLNFPPGLDGHITDAQVTILGQVGT